MHVTDVTKPLGKVGRESGRFREPSGRRIVDDATRQRRARQAIEALDSDNFHDDPHGDLGNVLQFILPRARNFYCSVCLDLFYLIKIVPTFIWFYI